MLLIPARIKQIKDEGRKEADKRFWEAVARFGYVRNGVRVLRFTPEVQRFLDGEEVEAPSEDLLRRHARARRRHRG